jgi:hypothetical protein
MQHRDHVFRLSETALETLDRLRRSEISGTRTIAVLPRASAERIPCK